MDPCCRPPTCSSTPPPTLIVLDNNGAAPSATGTSILPATSLALAVVLGGGRLAANANVTLAAGTKLIFSLQRRRSARYRALTSTQTIPTVTLAAGGARPLRPVTRPTPTLPGASLGPDHHQPSSANPAATLNLLANYASNGTVIPVGISGKPRCPHQRPDTGRQRRRRATLRHGAGSVHNDVVRRFRHLRQLHQYPDGLHQLRLQTSSSQRCPAMHVVKLTAAARRADYQSDYTRPCSLAMVPTRNERCQPGRRRQQHSDRHLRRDRRHRHPG